MKTNLLSLFGKMCLDYSHPVLAQLAEKNALSAEPSLVKKNPASYAEAMKFVDDFYLHIKERTSLPSFLRLTPSGLVEHGGFLTASFSALPKGVSGYSAVSLEQVLEPIVPRKYWHSPKACLGILRRADKRGKRLPAQLRTVLEKVACKEGTPDFLSPPEPETPKTANDLFPEH